MVKNVIHLFAVGFVMGGFALGAPKVGFKASKSNREPITRPAIKWKSTRLQLPKAETPTVHQSYGETGTYKGPARIAAISSPLSPF